jgi:hypothetical protein
MPRQEMCPNPEKGKTQEELDQEEVDKKRFSEMSTEDLKKRLEALPRQVVEAQEDLERAQQKVLDLKESQEYFQPIVEAELEKRKESGEK